MATLHNAQLRPAKIELLSQWVPNQPWAAGVDTSTLESVGAFRFDDPEGEVGVETHLLRTADGQIVQVPLTYRARALDGAGDSLITKMDHSVLGERWVYDASADPVFATTLATTILRGGEQAELIYLSEDGPQKREATTWARGSGSLSENVPDVKEITFAHFGNLTVIDTGDVILRVRRVVELGSAGDDIDEATLLGRWPGNNQWTLLSTAERTSRL
jgi:Maltokinase N-terminal cap domain